MKYFTLLQLFAICIFSTHYISAQDVTPIADGDIYSLSFDNIEFKVDAAQGAKVSSLSLGGTEFLVSPSGSSDFLWGSTLWPAPQNEMGWPPPMNLDDGAYAGLINGNIMTFASEEDFDDEGSAMTFQKAFWANLADKSISIRYSLINQSSKQITKALWELTRPPVNGLTFWPTGPAGTWGDLASSTVEENGHTWLDIDAESRRNLKFFADGSEGWFAHVDANRNLFVKTFDDVKEEDFADGEAELELWIANDYIELENLSATKTLNQYDTLHYDVKWYISALPKNIDATLGNMGLVSYVNQIIGNEVSNINTPLAKANFKIYPNPARNEINISGVDEIQTLTITNLTGHVLRTITINNTRTSVNIEDLSAGIYVVIINSNNNNTKHKVIVR